ncbi:MAG: flavodoxin family protein [Burkholderiaceae bacterium]|jgi:flavodoxin|nr:flavodoxin family protein [Gemmatimonadales bacterium]MCO5118589.1 flavodoxin family protein [Burkholderiaceae bacterium]MEB2317699.1 flavodoxin family protein [Pseudomonadota bacterium]
MNLLIVWWSLTGGSEQLARAAFEGALEQVGRDEVVMLRADRAGPEELLAARAALFVCPENLATMAGMMKDFFDRCYYPALGRIDGRPYATIVCAGSDGEGATRQIDRIATGWRMRRVAERVIVCTHAQTPEEILAPKRIGEADLADARELGASLAAGASMGVW